MLIYGLKTIKGLPGKSHDSFRTYQGFHHGLYTTHADLISAELLVLSQTDPIRWRRRYIQGRQWIAQMAYGIAYGATAAAFILADMIWLGSMVGRLYRPALGDLLLPGANLPPALLFYAAYPVGLLLFAVAPALKAQSLGMAVLYGALFGLFTYGTYDLTNAATLRNWPLSITLIDMLWGTVLGGLAALVGTATALRFAG
jgi:uncharacterized membrane protein